MDILLYKDGSYKASNADKSISKKDRENLKALLLRCKSEILGEFYVPIKYKYYKKIMDKIESITFRYNFLDGVDVDDEEQQYYQIIKFDEEYSSFREFITKFSELIVSESSLNSLFWVHSAFTEYCYDLKGIKVKFKSKNKKVKYTMTKFFSEFTGHKELFKHSVDFIDKNEYQLVTKLKDINSKDLTLVRLYQDILVPVDSKTILSIVSMENTLTLYLGDEGIEYSTLRNSELRDLVWIENHVFIDKFKKEWYKGLRELWQIPMHLHVINNMVYTPAKCWISAHVINKTNVNFKNKKKEKIEWFKLYNKIFNASIKYSNKKEVEEEMFMFIPKNGLAERLLRQNDRIKA